MPEESGTRTDRAWIGARVERALAGEEAAVRELVDELTPIIQRRVAQVLLFRGLSTSRLHQEVSDFTQEILVVLFSGPRILADWRPERGLGLESFVDMVARRRTLSMLRRPKCDPRRDDPTLTDELDGPSPMPLPDRLVADREHLAQLLERLQEALSPLGWHLFELLFLRELSVSEVSDLEDMTHDALYAWRSRLRKLAYQLREEILSGVVGSPSDRRAS